MPLFAIIGHDVADSGDKRSKARADHLARLHELLVENRLVIAGPTPIEHGQSQMSGSLIVASFDDLHSAKAWAADDPYIIAGVYSRVDVRPFIQVLPNFD